MSDCKVVYYKGVGEKFIVEISLCMMLYQNMIPSIHVKSFPFRRLNVYGEGAQQ